MKWWMALGLLAACGKGSEDPRNKKCAEIYGRLTKAAASLGAEMDAEAEKAFLKMCKETPEDLLPCLENPAGNPKCSPPSPLPAEDWK